MQAQVPLPGIALISGAPPPNLDTACEKALESGDGKWEKRRAPLCSSPVSSEPQVPGVFRLSPNFSSGSGETGLSQYVERDLGDGFYKKTNALRKGFYRPLVCLAG